MLKLTKNLRKTNHLHIFIYKIYCWFHGDIKEWEKGIIRGFAETFWVDMLAIVSVDGFMDMYLQISILKL